MGQCMSTENGAVNGGGEENGEEEPAEVQAIEDSLAGMYKHVMVLLGSGEVQNQHNWACHGMGMAHAHGQHLVLTTLAHHHPHATPHHTTPHHTTGGDGSSVGTSGMVISGSSLIIVTW